MKWCALAAVLAGCAPPPPPAALPSSHVAAIASDRWIAIGQDDQSMSSGGLVVAHLRDDKIASVTSVFPGGDFGWLDAHRLVVADAIAMHSKVGEDRVTVTTYVDGVLADTTSVSERDWPHQDFVELVMTRDNEAWLSKCVLRGNECDDDRVYERVIPAPRVDATRAPAGAQPGRADHSDDDPWPLPPTAAGPGPDGASLALGKVEVRVTDPYGGAAPHRELQDGVICRAGASHTTYPTAVWSQQLDFSTTRTVRWVSTSPPLYEIAEDSVNPAGFHHAHHLYARPCTAPFDGFAWLGDGLWASFALAYHDPPNGVAPGEPPRLEGEWTFHRGDVVIGTVHGTARLRSSYVPR